MATFHRDFVLAFAAFLGLWTQPIDQPRKTGTRPRNKGCCAWLARITGMLTLLLGETPPAYRREFQRLPRILGYLCIGMYAYTKTVSELISLILKRLIHSLTNYVRLGYKFNRRFRSNFAHRELSNWQSGGYCRWSLYIWN